MSAQRHSYAGQVNKSPLREFEINRERRQRYQDSRLATEVALLKFNTPFEKREHSPTYHAKTGSTAVNTTYNRHSSAFGYSSKVSPTRGGDCDCRRSRGRSPLQNSAYRASTSFYNHSRPSCQCSGSCMAAHGNHCHDTTSITRKSLMASHSQAVITTRPPRYTGNETGDKYSPPRRNSCCSRDRKSPLRERINHLEEDYLKDKLQRQIAEREARIAVLEA